MKVRSPRSTCGRKASCCALLKRCTSSTKRIVLRPDCCRASSARATASRISLTPASTAEIAMNSASNAFAMIRASVVLPTPGGPHRIMECGLPASNASRRGLPGPSRCDWPTNSSSERGRSRSASGASGSLLPKRSFTDDVRPLGRRESERLGRDLGVALDGRELDHRDLAELVAQFHRLEPCLAEAQPDPLEGGVLRPRHRLKPIEPVLVADGAEPVVLLDLVAACQQRCGAGAERAVVLAYRHLVQVLVVEPDPGAVADDDLLVGLVVLPAKLARPGELHGSRRLLQLLHILVEHHLREAGARRRGLLEHALEPLDGGGCRYARREDGQQQQ